jgi:hypothetical protein
MMDELANHGNRIHTMTRFGQNHVQDFIDTCASLEPDRHALAV